MAYQLHRLHFEIICLVFETEMSSNGTSVYTIFIFSVVTFRFIQWKTSHDWITDEQLIFLFF